MSDFDRNVAAARGGYADRAVAIDAGLRAHMIRVYNYMASAVALTAAGRAFHRVADVSSGRERGRSRERNARIFEDVARIGIDDPSEEEVLRR